METAAGTPDPPVRSTDGPSVWLFDADRTNQRLDVDDALERKVGDDQLPWIDTSEPLDANLVARMGERLKLGGSARAPAEFGTRPLIAAHGQRLHLRVMSEPGDATDGVTWVDVIVARNLVITAHEGPARFLEHFDERLESDATVGRLTASSFLRSLLDAVVTTYFEAVDLIGDDVDMLDARSLVARPDEDILPDLVDIRRRVARLRRLLSDHREVFAALVEADVSELADPDDEGFASLGTRFEDAIHSVEDSRDLLLGSFDVFMSRLAQRTNDAMKVLALATVLLLPGSLIAGLLGMNLVVPLPNDQAGSFWIVVAVIVVLATIVLVGAWRARWIRFGRATKQKRS
jgi:Mg2+ and Co2+ transporter CorA